ncbi:hypothetical protein DW682_00190 [Collinsella intestinalis]|uniref:Uncharacterized protein n=1 Tax=Collinsella intestinalis TaxID=147207 RepID=A0A414NEE0_9ACTN|nr:hypothetical protein DW682_00190 [Collinsella intestinalis]
MGTNNSINQLTQRANVIQMDPIHLIEAVKCSKTLLANLKVFHYDSQLDILWGRDDQIGIFYTLTSLVH